MLPKNDLVFQEVLISLLSGGVIAAVTARIYGYEPLILFLKSLNPGGPLLAYLIALVALSTLIAFIEKTLVSKNIDIPVSFLRMRIIAFELGSVLIGVFRVMAGALIISSIPLIVVEQSYVTFATFGLSYLLAPGLVCATCVLHRIANEHQP